MLQAEAREAGTQWRVQFTKLENLIQRNLNHPKVRCFLWALLLWKTHMQGSTSSASGNSIGPQHLRHQVRNSPKECFLYFMANHFFPFGQFYWMVERNPAQWTEENLGENLLQLLREMKSSLRRQKLPNYFLSRENLFDSVPRHKLARALERFHRFQENPVPFIMVAIKRLHYDADFYPGVDVDKLHDILTTTETLALINPALLKASKPTNAFERWKLFLPL